MYVIKLSSFFLGLVAIAGTIAGSLDWVGANTAASSSSGTSRIAADAGLSARDMAQIVGGESVYCQLKDPITYAGEPLRGCDACREDSGTPTCDNGVFKEYYQDPPFTWWTNCENVSGDNNKKCNDLGVHWIWKDWECGNKSLYYDRPCVNRECSGYTLGVNCRKCDAGTVVKTQKYHKYECGAQPPE